MLGSNGSFTFPIWNNDYFDYNSHERLAFVDAIHVYEDDRLYIVSELVKNGVTREQYIITTESGEEFIDNLQKQFYIESEATNRSPNENNKIAPEEGGWISLGYGNVPSLIRGKLREDVFPAVFNVAEPPYTDWQDGKATSNDIITLEEKVIAGEGIIQYIMQQIKKLL